MKSKKWHLIRLGQLHRLLQLAEYGQSSNKVDRVNASTYSKDLDALDKLLGGGKLTSLVNRQRVLNENGEMIVRAFEPVLKLCERISNGELLKDGEQCFRLGAGGSLVSWLVGSRLTEIKKALKVKKSGRPPRFVAEVLRNRDIVLRVSSGALDCGLVPKRMTADPRLFLETRDLGRVFYYLYVPKKWLDSEELTWPEGTSLSPDAEERILFSRPIATVGPEGEFRVQLELAFQEKFPLLDIEFEYRAFPMVLPHVMKGSHVVIMPDVKKLGDVDLNRFDYAKFKLGAFERSGHFRDVVLAFRKDAAKRLDWIDFEKLAKHLSF